MSSVGRGGREADEFKAAKISSQRAARVLRENPAGRGTETSAEVLVGPPGRMVSNAGPLLITYYYLIT